MPPSSPRLHVLLVCAILGASLGAFVPAFQYAGEDTTYITYATLQAQSAGPDGGAPFPAHDAARWRGLEIRLNRDLQSPELGRAAQQAVARRFSLSLAMSEVLVLAAAEPETSTFFVTAQGTDVDYVPSYLTGLLDAFLVARVQDPDSKEQWSITEPVSVPVEEKWAWVLPMAQGVLAGGVFGGVASLLWEWGRHRKLKALDLDTADPASPHAVGGRRRVSVGVWLVPAGILVGLLVQTVRLSSTPPSFCSLGKVMIVDEEYPGFQTDRHRTLIDWLESEELSRRAAKRTQARFPELTPREVEVTVHQTRATTEFSVLVSGREPHYAKTFLNGLLDEFMESSQPFGKVMVRERATVAAERLEEWEIPLAVGAGSGASTGLLLTGVWWLCRRLRRPRLSLAGSEASA